MIFRNQTKSIEHSAHWLYHGRSNLIIQCAPFCSRRHLEVIDLLRIEFFQLRRFQLQEAPDAFFRQGTPARQRVEKLWEKSQNFNDFENFEWEKKQVGWCWDDLPLFIMLHHVSGLCGASVWVDDQKLPKVCAKPSKTHILACKRRVTPRKANSPATSQSFRYINYKKNQNDQQTYNQDHTQIHLLHLSSWCNYDNVRCSPLNDPKDNQPMRRSSY